MKHTCDRAPFITYKNLMWLFEINNFACLNTSIYSQNFMKWMVLPVLCDSKILAYIKSSPNLNWKWERNTQYALVYFATFKKILAIHQVPSKFKLENEKWMSFNIIINNLLIYLFCYLM